MAIILILIIVIYDNVKPQKESAYAGKTLNLTGKVKGIKCYEPSFGEKSFTLKIEEGPDELPAFLVKIKESRLISGCNIKAACSDVKEIEKQLYGMKVKCRGKFENFEKPFNPGQFDAASHYRNEGFSGILKAESIHLANENASFSPAVYLHRLNIAISQKYQKILGIKEAGSLSAMVLGDKSNLDEEIKELYQENSISHLLSISGLHISLVGGAVYVFLKKLKISFRFPLISAGIILFLYGLFTGFSVSTARAVIMMCIFFFSFIIGRSYDLPSGLALAGIVEIILNHRIIYQSGFQLSFLAVIGIFYIMPELMYVFKIQNLQKKGKRKIIYIILSSIVCSISINLATLPIILMNFYEISLTGIILNIIVIPLMSILVITGLIGGLVSLIAEAAGGFILGAAYYILNIYTLLCRIGNSLTAFRLILGKPGKLQIAIYYTLLFLIIYFLSKKRRLEKIESLKGSTHCEKNISKNMIITVLVICFGYTVLIYRKEEFSINMLDIGQGDCFVINDEKKNVFISDCGSTTVNEVGKQRLLPFMKSKGWGRVNTIFVSHMDKDHVNGVNDLLKCPEIAIDKIVISTSYKADNLNCSELKELKNLAEKRKVNIFYIKKGDVIKQGELSFKCIYPIGDEHIEDQNEASIVMRMEYKGLSALFTGDIAASTEEEVLKRSDEKLLNCDILKVCHHGSKNSSSSRFLEKTDPKLYLVSCGLMNRYGHPHKAALERMGIEGGRIFRTDHMGAVEIKLKDGKIVAGYNSKDLSDKEFIPAKECDCEDCKKIKINTHIN